jgi:FAD/FMN-containing dehydrogenase
MIGILEQLQLLLPGKVYLDDATRDKYKRDASVFEMKPQAVVVPDTIEELQKLVQFVNEHKKHNPELSLSVRAAGTCMSGGSLTESILIVIEKFNKILRISAEDALVQPGVYYRDFEKEIAKHNLVYPPYPSSKRLCTLGGIAANNAGGEKSLQNGKAEDFVKDLKVILKDGLEYSFKKLNLDELEKKLDLHNTEGEIYRDTFRLFNKYYDLIQKNKPNVSKNSAGFNIWKVWDKKHFDLSQVFVGSQGTLGIITELNFRLLPKKKHRGMLVCYLDNLDNLPQIVQTVLKFKPESFETFDDYTLKLALKYVTGFSSALKISKFETIKAFLHEYMYVLVKGMPKLVLLIEFEEESMHDINGKIHTLADELVNFENLVLRITRNEAERQKYWVIRRESFNLLRKKINDKYAAPFIDDTCVRPEVFPQFLPELYKIFDQYDLQATIAGHIGNGNFHIIPLMDFSNPKEKEKLYKVARIVFDLTVKLGGTLSGEHNDGLIRTPYLHKMFSPEILHVFKELKHIFDPQNIFNPHKKIDLTEEYTYRYVIKQNHVQEQVA